MNVANFLSHAIYVVILYTGDDDSSP